MLVLQRQIPFVFNISLKEVIASHVGDLGFQIKVRAVQGHSSLPPVYNPDALGDRLEPCKAMGYIFHAPSNVSSHSINQRGLMLSPFAHALGKEKGLVDVRFVYAGGTTPRHGIVIRRGKDIHYWNLNYEKFLADGFQLRGTPSGVVLITIDVPSRAYLGPLCVTPPEHYQQSVPREPPMPPPPRRENPPDSSHDAIVLKTRHETAKQFSRFISSINMVTCNPWYLWFH